MVSANCRVGHASPLNKELSRHGLIIEKIQFAAIQGQSLNEVVSFLSADVEFKKCIEISIVDDDVALEGTEEWTLQLEATERQNYALGDIHTALLQVIDDDGMETIVP